MTRAATSSSLGVLTLAALLGCSKPERVEAPDKAAPHLGDDWFDYRAKTLGVSPDQAKLRDAALPEDAPPSLALDRSTALEAAVVFRSVCSSCHGSDGKPPESTTAGAPRPREWSTFGSRMGFFFGGDKMRAGLYRKIRDGGEAKDGVASNMPGWGSTLSREQMWALVRHIESF